MEHKPEHEFRLTYRKMRRLISQGRLAIEYGLLLILIRPRATTKEDEAELAELSAVLQQFNKLMAQYEKPKQFPAAANDESKGE